MSFFPLLPAHTVSKCCLQELKVERIAQEVHEGLHFLHRPSLAASKGQAMEWLSDLSRLSGGERTLVSLALILAVNPSANLPFVDLWHICLVRTALLPPVHAHTTANSIIVAKVTIASCSSTKEFSYTRTDCIAQTIPDRFVCTQACLHRILQTHITYKALMPLAAGGNSWGKEFPLPYGRGRFCQKQCPHACYSAASA